MVTEASFHRADWTRNQTEKTDCKVESQEEELEIMQKNGHLVRFLSGESNQCVFAKK